MSIENKDLEIVKEKVGGMKAMIEKTEVTNDEQLAAVSDKIKNVKTLGKFIKQKKEEFTEPAKQIIENAKQMFDGPIKECANAEEVLKAKAEKYLLKKEEDRKKAETKIAEDLQKGKIKKTETALKKMEALPDQQKVVRTENSGLRMTKRNVAEIVDRNLIPDEYWVVDEVRVKRAALENEKNGLDPIPGVIIKVETGMASV